MAEQISGINDLMILNTYSIETEKTWICHIFADREKENKMAVSFTVQTVSKTSSLTDRIPEL